MAEQLYIRIEDLPNFDKEDIEEMSIRIYSINGTDYVKVDVCCNFENDWKKFFCVDIELTEAGENSDSGQATPFGSVASKDFFPVNTELLIEEDIL